MLKFILISSFLIVFCSCNTENTGGNIVTAENVFNPLTASEEDATDLLPEIEFEKAEHDFGKIIEGEKVSCNFKFKNTGNSDLIIYKAQGSCGCTVPTWPKDGVKPGNENQIEVVFDSDGKKGNQLKKITLVMNTIPNTIELAVKAEVVE